MFLTASKSVISYLLEFAISYDACNVLIIRRETLRLTTLDMMKVAMPDCYEFVNLI